VATVREEMGDRLLFAFRHFPLTTIHPHAEAAAEAAEAAGAQQRFWEMHDTLFANQPRFQPRQLLTYAEELGLDVNSFSKDLTERAFAEKIANDFMGGVRSGVNGTPTFFINGVRHDASYDAASLLAALDRSLVFR
jgi:protein-disulfide isomerase